MREGYMVEIPHEIERAAGGTIALKACQCYRIPGAVSSRAGRALEEENSGA